MLMIYAVIGGLVALVIALYYNAQQKALRLSQLHKELRHLTEQLESTQQQLKIKEKLYEGSYLHASHPKIFLAHLLYHAGATPSLLPSRPPHASAAD
jgi:hypothetical protein